MVFFFAILHIDKVTVTMIQRYSSNDTDGSSLGGGSKDF